MSLLVPYDVVGNIVGNEHAKLALLLNLIDPECGGVILVGKKGTGKSLLLNTVKSILIEIGLSFVELPLNISHENLTGTVDIEKTLKTGKKVYLEGILKKSTHYIIVDNLNLFSEEMIFYIFQHAERYRCPVICAMNPDEGLISEHFLDKIGMCVVMEHLEKDKLKELLNTCAINNFFYMCHNGAFRPLESPKIENKFNNTERIFDGYQRFLNHISQLKHKIFILRSELKKVKIKESLLEYISKLSIENFVFSNRADIFLYHCARALCILEGLYEIRKAHIEKVMPFVFLHRNKKSQNSKDEDTKREHEHQNEHKNNQQKDNGERQDKEKTSLDDKSSSSHERTDNSSSEKDATSSLTMFSSFKEELFDIGDPFKIQRFIFRKDRIIRQSSGKRTKTKSFLKNAKKIKSVPYYHSKDKDLDILATIKAAVPFQRIRGNKDRIIVLEEDYRYKEKEKKTGHVVIFLVDASGSMAAQKRMIAVKGAIFSFLMDCYQKRDKVCMITFKDKEAKVMLPVTSSSKLAYKCLKELPTGGKTPLSMGLLRAYEVIKRHHLKFPLDRIILTIISDGRANVSIEPKSDPLDEVTLLCKEISKLEYVDSIVIDTEIKNMMSMDISKDMAKDLFGAYFPLEDIEREDVINIVSLFRNF